MKSSDDKWEINPAYLTATHIDLMVYPCCPSFEEQLRMADEFDEKLKNLVTIKQNEKETAD